MQRDLPAALVTTATYSGIKGTRAVQAFLPNTYPAGAANPCPSCPSGYTYLTSNGNSTRESGQFQLRRRLHNGFTATAQYTYSKSIDDAALGGRGQVASVIAQNWLDLSAERGLSNFDQRHQVTLQTQYTTGMGVNGGALLHGWKGTAFKEWTLISNITAGSGLPLTPIYSVAVVRDGRDRADPAGQHGRARVVGFRRAASESGGVRRAESGTVGQCGKELHYRTLAVHHERVVGAHVPADESRLPHRRHECAQSRDLSELEHGDQQRAVRTADDGECDAQPADHAASEVLRS